MSASKRDTTIPRRPLLWLAAALLFTLPPMFGSLATWVPSLFLFALVMKFWMEPKGYRLRFSALKLMLTGVALFAIFVSYGSLNGIAAGWPVFGGRGGQGGSREKGSAAGARSWTRKVVTPPKFAPRSRPHGKRASSGSM